MAVKTSGPSASAESQPKSNVFLEARNVTLSYPLPANLANSTDTGVVGGRIVGADRDKRLVAVDDVSFRLEAGDTLGLVGHNGSGKTTLLKILAGILCPQKGEVISNGTIGNALDINIGFRPEATGRQNIRLKSLITGKKGHDIRHIVESVEDFAELGTFLDMPVHSYSAGMRARLAFGIATAFHYDILILDEWLSAGDQQMQEKAAQRMDNFVKRSAITILASHQHELIDRISNRIVRLEHGKIST